MVSLPSRERGLKLVDDGTGAGVVFVAPFTGAWIEIPCMVSAMRVSWSLPSRERGLKCRFGSVCHLQATSLPSRERGLKFLLVVDINPEFWSLPSRERGLKF